MSAVNPLTWNEEDRHHFWLALWSNFAGAVVLGIVLLLVRGKR